MPHKKKITKERTYLHIKQKKTSKKQTNVRYIDIRQEISSFSDVTRLSVHATV